MESLTYLKQLRVSSKSLRFVVPHVRRIQPQKALEILMYSPKKESRFLYKAINSAIHNAVQTLKVSPDVLQFKLFTVEQGRPLKRYRPGARGGVRPVKKKFSHIKIILVAKQEQPTKKVKENKEVENVVKVKKQTKPKISKQQGKKIDKKDKEIKTETN